MRKMLKNYKDFLKAVMQVRVDLSERNPALMSLLENPEQTTFLGFRIYGTARSFTQTELSKELFKPCLEAESH